MIHELDPAVIWHGRLMVLAWAILLPLGVIIARYFKILPRQNWPENLDNQTWWHGHLLFQIAGATATCAAFYLIFSGLPLNFKAIKLHGILGWTTIALLLVQIGFGLLRGSKGGPTEVVRTGSERGDHFDMTVRRRVFESVHKISGYVVLVIAQITIVLGLQEANAPAWMLITLVIWWLVCISGIFFLESRHLRMGSYEAIWGTDAMGRQAKPSYQDHPWVN